MFKLKKSSTFKGQIIITPTYAVSPCSTCQGTDWMNESLTTILRITCTCTHVCVKSRPIWIHWDGQNWTSEATFRFFYYYNIQKLHHLESVTSLTIPLSSGTSYRAVALVLTEVSDQLTASVSKHLPDNGVHYSRRQPPSHSSPWKYHPMLFSWIINFWRTAMEASSPHGKIRQNQILSEQTQPQLRYSFHRFMTWYKFIELSEHLMFYYCYFSALLINKHSNFTWT